MAVVKREWTWNGEQHVAWQCKFRDQNGKRRAKQFDTKKEAVEFDRKVSGQVDEGTFVADRDSITIKEAGKLWIEACKRGGDRPPVQPHTLRVYEQRLRDHIVPRIGELRLKELTGPKVREFRDHLLEKLGRSTAKMVLTALKGVLNEARRAGKMATDPARGVNIASSRRERSRQRIPSKSDARAVLGAARALLSDKHPQVREAWKRYHPLFMTGFLTGLRASELRGLPWSNVDLDKARIKVDRRADEKGVIGRPKSAAGHRFVEIPAELVSILEAWRKDCPKSKLDLVFPNGEGHVESLANIYHRGWVKLMERTGLMETVMHRGKERQRPIHNIHSMRHFFVSLRIAAGATPKEIMTEAGHSSIQITFDLYGHLFADDNSHARSVADRAARELLGG